MKDLKKKKKASEEFLSRKKKEAKIKEIIESLQKRQKELE